MYGIGIVIESLVRRSNFYQYISQKERKNTHKSTDYESLSNTTGIFFKKLLFFSCMKYPNKQLKKPK